MAKFLEIYFMLTMGPFRYYVSMLEKGVLKMLIYSDKRGGISNSYVSAKSVIVMVAGLNLKLIY